MSTRDSYVAKAEAEFAEVQAQLAALAKSAKKAVTAAEKEGSRIVTAAQSRHDEALHRFELDQRWKLDFVSPAIEALTGRPAADFLGQEAFAHPDDAPALREAIEAAIAGHKPWSLEYRVLHAGGRERWVYDNGQVVL